MQGNLLLKRTQFVSRYLEWLTEKDVELLDLNMIEAFYLEDKKYHPSNLVFERNNEMHAIRSDWTRSILNYKKLFNLSGNKYGYFGPVLREYQTIYQVGLEMFDVSGSEIQAAILMHIEYIEKESDVSPRVMIVNNEELIDLYLEKYELGEHFKEIIFAKDFSGLADNLGKDHPLYQLMAAPVSQQYDLILKEFPTDKRMKFIQQLKEAVKPYKLKFILDLSFQPPQRYYDGFYCQVFLDKNVPALSGGQYEKNAFGLAINLSDGGVL